MTIKTAPILTAMFAACILQSAQASDLKVISEVREQRIDFQSITPRNRWEFVRKVVDHTKVVTVYGDLFMPKRPPARVPAVVISHASGGVTETLTKMWAGELNDVGIAVFVVDSFKPRGIDTTTTNQGQVDVSANVADALNALVILSKIPQIDSRRIFHMGGSRGGTAVMETYWPIVREAVIDSKSALKFAGHIPLFQGNCNTRFRFDDGKTSNSTPMLALLGGADDGAPADACMAYYTELKNAGANIRWKVYADAPHGFDGDGPKTYLPQGVTAKNCAIEVFITNVRGSGLGVARNYKTGESISGFPAWDKAFADCNGRGFTYGGDRNARKEAVKDVIQFINAN